VTTVLAAVVDAPLALAFGAGMVAAVNPCGFAMLPAYLSYFVGLEESQPPGPERALPRAIGVGLVVTAGFIAVFGLVGLVVTQISTTVLTQAKWATIVIGLVLCGLGVALLAGRQLTIPLPHLERGGTRRELGSMLLFGVSYAVASLSCALVPFLAATSSSFSRSGLVSGSATFGAYALGMGAIVTMLTVAVALARGSVVRAMRRIGGHVTRLSGALVLVAGLYVAYYGWYEVRLERGGSVDDPVVDAALDVQTAITDWIDGVGTTRLGLVCLAGVLGVALVGWTARRSRSVGGDAAPMARPQDRAGQR
jgi:cytochrome c biogenesis protein CcdA